MVIAADGTVPGTAEERLHAHLRAALGVWPPPEPFSVVSSPRRAEPGWDGLVRPLAGLVTPDATVVSVAPGLLDAARALLERTGPEAFLDELPALVPGTAGRIGRGVFRWCSVPAPLDEPGTWVDPADPRVPEWLRPFNGEVLVAFDEQGRYLAGVGRKRHDAWAQELAVVTDPEHRGQGLARRLVAQAARRVAAEGAVATYMHRADNAASAAVADAAGFPDRGWSVLVHAHAPAPAPAPDRLTPPPDPAA